MDTLDSDIIDTFLTANLFEDEFMLEQFTTDDPNIDLTSDLTIHGITEELESWAGGSSASSSPTFSPQNVSPSDSDEEKYLANVSANPYDFLRDVVVDQRSNTSSSSDGGVVVLEEASTRDTPSPGSISSSSGCYSDFSCTTVDTNIYPMSPPGQAMTAQNIVEFNPNQYQKGYPLQFVQRPNIAPKAVQQIPANPKTVILSPQDFGQLMNTMKVTKEAPRIQTVVQPMIIAQPQTTVKPRTVKPVDPIICLPNQVIDERTYKKQQRLIRNRESANLSRKKKKDFVDSLQDTIQQLGQEKEQLAVEINLLRTQLLNNVCSKCGQSAMQDANAKGQQRSINGFVTKKNSMVVLAMLLTVSLNFGPLNNMLTSPSSDLPSPLPQSAVDGDVQLRRHILWAEDDSLKNNSNSANSTNINHKLNYNHSIQPPSITTNTSSSNCNPSDPKQQEQQDHHPQYINQTENIRIASELHRWIGEPEYLNSTRRPARLSPILASLDTDDIQKSFDYDGNFLDNLNLMPKKYRKMQLRNRRNNKKHKDKYAVERRRVVTQEDAGQVDVFNSGNKGEMKYAELFKELRRRDDTFYVVSFNADHLMLPALAYNKTKRPKMSLMFPALGFNGTIEDDHVMMMQIDCEVLDTAMIQVKEKLIPHHLRRFQNGTQGGHAGEETTKGAVQERNVTREFGPQLRRNSSKRGGLPRKPYFVENPRFDNATAHTGSAGGFN